MNFNKILKILTNIEIRKLVFLSVLLLIAIFIDLIGIGIVFPVLEIFIGEKPVLLEKISEYFNFEIQDLKEYQLIKISLFLLTFIYFIKTVSLIFIIFIKNKFFSDLCSSISSRLFSLYLSQPFKFFLKKNSAELVRNVTGESSLFTFGVISSLTVLMNEIIIVLGISVLLFYTEPTGAIIIFVIFAFFSFIYFSLTKKKLKIWGEKRQIHDTARYQHLFQGFGGIKEITLLKNSEFFVNKFNTHNALSFKMLMLSNTLNQFPRLGLEFLAILIFSTGSFFVATSGTNLVEILPTLGLFTISAFRLLPSISKILSSMQTFKYNKVTIDTLYEQLNKLNQNKIEKSKTSYKKIDFKTIDLKNISFKFDDQKNYLFKKLNLNFNSGNIVGICGESGSGKSTLINLLTGLLSPSSGEIMIDSKNLNQVKDDWQSSIGFVPQSVFLLDDTVKNNIALGVKLSSFNEKKFEKVLKEASLSDFIQSLEKKEDTIIGENGARISGGQKQRIGIARALYFDPSILIFDESTSALDVSTESQIIETIKYLGKQKTIVIITHKMKLLDICSKKFELKNSELKTL